VSFERYNTFLYIIGGLIRINRFMFILLFVYVAGCSLTVPPTSLEHINEFENAGPSIPSVDLNRLAKARISGGPYRVVPGDMLELTLPAILHVVTAEEPEFPDRVVKYMCRVSETRTITLPMIGDIDVAQKSLTEVESAVIDAYYPMFTVTRPSVAIRVVEYNKAKVSITGAVENPGVYELRSDEMSLVALLMQAGGIVKEGIDCIRIIHSDEAAGGIEKATLKKIPKHINQKVIEGLANPNNIETPANPAYYAVPDEIKIQLTFVQFAPTDTFGLITIRHEDAIILTEELDITSAIQRQVVLEKLAQMEPCAPIAAVRQKLYVLANMLKTGSGMYNSRGNIDQQYITSNPRSNVSNLKHISSSEDALYKQLVKTYEELVETLDVHNPPGVIKEVLLDKVNKSEPIVLPVKGLNIPFADVALQDGDTVILEPLEPEIFTVTGLVNKPDNFPYPANVKYNLMQALASAGGLDKVAEPRYATIYRLKADGTIIDKTFQIVKDSKLTNALNTTIKPGDIIDVAHTVRTRKNVFWDRMFRVTFGAFVPLFQ
jgi:protein involved in polysaccharide export with SLBB domain